MRNKGGIASKSHKKQMLKSVKMGGGGGNYYNYICILYEN